MTPQRILQLAPVACYLSANEVAKGQLFGRRVDPTNPLKIFNVYTVLKKVYDYDPDYDGLQVRCDYLYELLKRYAVRAAAIVDGNSGGSVAPPTPSGVVPAPIQFAVDMDEFMEPGNVSKVFPPSWIGYDLLFIRSNIPQAAVPVEGGTYYSWDKETGTLTLFGPLPTDGAAQPEEVFQFFPIR
jgi:hypothetical protein